MQKLTRVKLKKVSVYIVLHHRCGIYRMTPPRSQGPLQKKVWEIVKGRSGRNEVKLSSGHYRVSAFMNSQQMQLPAQDLHKIKPISIPVWTGEGTQMNKTYMRSNQSISQCELGKTQKKKTCMRSNQLIFWHELGRRTQNLPIVVKDLFTADDFREKECWFSLRIWSFFKDRLAMLQGVTSKA